MQICIAYLPVFFINEIEHNLCYYSLLSIPDNVWNGPTIKPFVALFDNYHKNVIRPEFVTPNVSKHCLINNSMRFKIAKHFSELLYTSVGQCYTEFETLALLECHTLAMKGLLCDVSPPPPPPLGWVDDTLMITELYREGLYPAVD